MKQKITDLSPTLHDKQSIKSHSYYENSNLSASLNILDIKIKKSSNTKSNSIENQQCNDYSNNNTYVNLVRKVRHSPPSNKE